MFDHETLTAVGSHSIGEYPREACGVIGCGDHGFTVYPARNAATDPDRGFLVHPDDQRQVLLRIAQQGETLEAIYHSHPSGSPAVSDSDREFAALRPGLLHLIFAFESGWVAFAVNRDRRLSRLANTLGDAWTVTCGPRDSR